jgi:hypothetical protein
MCAIRRLTSAAASEANSLCDAYHSVDQRRPSPSTDQAARKKDAENHAASDRALAEAERLRRYALALTEQVEGFLKHVVEFSHAAGNAARADDRRWLCSKLGHCWHTYRLAAGVLTDADGAIQDERSFC